MERGGKQYWEEVDWMILERKDWDGLKRQGRGLGVDLNGQLWRLWLGGFAGDRRYIKDWFLEDFLSC